MLSEGKKITIRGFSEYEGWVGVLGPLISSTRAQGRGYSTMIAPTADAEPIEVYLPEGVIRVVEEPEAGQPAPSTPDTP